MSINQNNFTFLWITLAFVLFPAALVHGVPLNSIVDPLEEIVPEEPLPLKIIEEVTEATSAPLIQHLSLLFLPKALSDKKVVAVNEESPINNLNISMEHPTLDQTNVEEKERRNDEIVVLSVQEKPLIKLLSQEPSEVTYELIEPEQTTTLSAAVKAFKYSGIVTDYDQTSFPIDKIFSTTSAPVFEESITTKSKLTLDKELLQLQKLKKSTSHKKQVLLKILDKIVSQVLIEECNLSVEEILPTTLTENHEVSKQRVEELEEISQSEKKVLLQRVIKALNLYLETEAIEPAKVENVSWGHSLSLEEPKSSGVKEVSASDVDKLTKSQVVTDKPNPTKINDNMFRQYWVPKYSYSNSDTFENYFLKPRKAGVPRIG